MVKILTDDECSAFRRLPCGFNDMVRAIYKAGWEDYHNSKVEMIKIADKIVAFESPDPVIRNFRGSQNGE